jgi:RNA polymerase sigma-70 factor (ECF subfamily)
MTTALKNHVDCHGHMERRYPVSIEERRLVRRLQAGDSTAFETLFQHYSTRVYRQALALLDNVAEAEEVVQDVFLTLYTKIGTFRGEAGLATWLYRLTANASLSRLRRRGRRREVSLQECQPRCPEDSRHMVQPVVDWSCDLERDIMHAQALCFLQQAIEALRPLDRAVVTLGELEGLANRRIGTILGLSESAVKSRRHRACSCLRGTLTATFAETE